MSNENLVLTALRFEERAFRPLSTEPGWRVAVTGVGPIHGRKEALRIMETVKPARIFGVGLCGGLDTSSRRGAVAVPEEVVDDAVSPPIQLDKLPSHFSEGLRRRLAAAVRNSVRSEADAARFREGGRMISVGNVAATTSEKRLLNAEFGADWVDQETYAWADCARLFGIPFYAIRVVLDTQDDELPTWSRPRTWPTALSLPSNALRSRRILSHIGRELACARW